jgi:hypothetical protein
MVLQTALPIILVFDIVVRQSPGILTIIHHHVISCISSKPSVNRVEDREEQKRNPAQPHHGIIAIWMKIS